LKETLFARDLKKNIQCSVMKMGGSGLSQGAEERSSLLSKLLFSRYSGSHKVSLSPANRELK
jgi:hypothetical protein